MVDSSGPPICLYVGIQPPVRTPNERWANALPSAFLQQRQERPRQRRQFLVLQMDDIPLARQRKTRDVEFAERALGLVERQDMARQHRESEAGRDRLLIVSSLPSVMRVAGRIPRSAK